MRIMYVACNPDQKSDLLLEREITELQRRSDAAIGDIDFHFYPHQHVENLPVELAKLKPDVVHFSAHGEENKLVMSNDSGVPVVLSAQLLKRFFSFDKPPQLVYLNACDSHDVAKQLIVDTVDMAIGATAPITNKAARASAVLFYDRLIDGAFVSQAFEASRAMVEGMQMQQASMALFAKNGVVPAATRLHRSPKIVARFRNDDARANEKGKYHAQFGLVGCPANTIQLAFFTDDKTFIGEDSDADDETDLASDLCAVVRDVPFRNTLWSYTTWTSKHDFRIVCCGLTADGTSFSVVSSFCEALKTYYGEKGKLASGTAEQRALAVMQALDEDADADESSSSTLREERKRVVRNPRKRAGLSRPKKDK
jgi:hypothetical protein